MRHDKSSNTSEIDPALEPPRGDPASGSGADLYVPGEDDVELIDQAEGDQAEDDQEHGLDSDFELSNTLPRDTSEELEPPWGSSLPGSALMLQNEEAPPPAEGDLHLLDIDGDPASGELIVDAWADRPAEGRVSVRPSKIPGSRPGPANELRLPPPPPLPGEGSPWAADGDAAIDASALPSAHSPVAEPKPAPVAPQLAAPPPSRPWLMIFLIIAVVAFGTTFLILLFNVGQKPQEAPGAGAPIQVPTGAATAAGPASALPSVASTPVPATQAPSAPAEPIELQLEDTADPAPSATVVAIPTVMVTTSPSGAPGPRPTSGPKPGGTQPSKKPSRIF